MKQILIIGLGYLGKALADHLQSHAYEVTGTTRSQDKLSSYKSMKLWPLSSLEGYKTIVFCAGADNSSSYQSTYLENARYILPLLKPDQQLIYTSSTSVYGDHEGRFVDEKTPLNPNNSHTKILAETEQVFLRYPHSCILRLGELMGPGRSLEDRLARMQGQVLPGNGKAYANLTFLNDVLTAITLAIERPLYGIFNVCSPFHLPRKTLYNLICEKRGWQTFSWDASKNTIHSGSKRVLSSKIEACGMKFDTVYSSLIQNGLNNY